MEMHINMMAVLVAVVANFIFGFIWYTPLFGKAWAQEMKFDTSVKPPSSEMAKGMIFMVIGNFLMAYVFASNMMAWSHVPNEMSTLENILSAAGFTWLGFYLPGDLGSTVWEKKSMKLFAINTGYHFGTLLIAAIVLTYM